ncbi:MAG: hypothetical protein ABIQ98_05905 [Sphingomicrobium sp.]
MSTRRPTRLPSWQEWAVYVSLGLLAASGLGWLVLDQWVRVAGEFGPEPHPAEHIALIVHGVAAYGLLIVVGSLLPAHVLPGWRIGRNRGSGLFLGAVLVLLTATALGLYYAGDEIARHWASIAHWMVGLALVPLLIFHALAGRRDA